MWWYINYLRTFVRENLWVHMVIGTYKGWVHGSIRQHQMQHVSAHSEVDRWCQKDCEKCGNRIRGRLSFVTHGIVHDLYHYLIQLRICYISSGWSCKYHPVSIRGRALFRPKWAIPPSPAAWFKLSHWFQCFYFHKLLNHYTDNAYTINPSESFSGTLFVTSNITIC
jgi:hypothetical protein